MNATARDVLLTDAFYGALLDLERVSEIEPLIEEGVELITRITEARVGYVEFFPVASSDKSPFSAFHSNTGPPEVEAWVSRAIIEAAVEDRATINLALAIQHPRFRMSKSVASNAIRAVLCTPIGVADPVGVVYLQGRQWPGRFSDIDRDRAERFAAQLAVIADRIREQQPTRPTLAQQLRRYARQALDRNRGNVSSTARELGIPRSRLYRLLKRHP